MTDKKHCNYIIGGSEPSCDHLFSKEPTKECLDCRHFKYSYESYIKVKNENKDALLLFLSENTLGTLNEMLINPIPTKELKTWFLTLDEYKGVIQKAIENCLNEVTNDLVSAITIKTTPNIDHESILPMFIDDGSVLFCDSIGGTTVNDLPEYLSLIHRDKDGAENRVKYYIEKRTMKSFT